MREKRSTMVLMAFIGLLLFSHRLQAAAKQSLPAVEDIPNTRPTFGCLPGTPSRFVNISSATIFLVNDFSSVHTVEVRVADDTGEYRGRQYVLKGRNLRRSLEVITPLQPCTTEELQIEVTYREGGRLQTRDRFADYRGECCVNGTVVTQSPVKKTKTDSFAVVILLLAGLLA